MKQTIDTKTTVYLGAGFLAATSTCAQAQLTQITQFGNQINSLTGFSLNLDLTGDGVNDFKTVTSWQHSNGAASMHMVENEFNLEGFGAYVNYDSTRDNPYRASIFSYVANGPSNNRTSTVRNEIPMNGLTPQAVSALIPITITDVNINNGAATEAFVEITGFNTNPIDHTTALTRVIFDESSTTLAKPDGNATYQEFSAVPEPSSIALLALGAGGVLLRRKRAC